MLFGTNWFNIYLEGSLALTLGTGAGLDLLVLGLDEGAENIVTLVTVVLDHAQLGQHAGGRRDHSGSPDQLIEMQLTQRADLLHEGQVADAHVDLLEELKHRN